MRLVKSVAIGGGFITVLAQGDVGSVKAAVDAGSAAAGRVGELVSSHILARPHPDLVAQVRGGEEAPGEEGVGGRSGKRERLNP